MLKQHITQEYLDGLWSKSTYYMLDNEESDIIDMLVKPLVHKNLQTQEIFELDSKNVGVRCGTKSNRAPEYNTLAHAHN